MAIQDVFIVMPFTEQTVVTSDGERSYDKAHFDDIYEILKGAVRQCLPEAKVDRMENPPGNIVTAIIRRLATADVVIAVLSGKNPNVFYELGIRHSLKKNTIMLLENRDEYPFDLTGYFSEVFSVKHESDRAALRKLIEERLALCDEEPQDDSPVLDVLGQAEYEQLRAINAWETRRAAVVLHGLLDECSGIGSVFVNSAEYLEDFEPDSTVENPPLMDLEWDTIDGFTKNRPVLGLPTVAYTDAARVYSAWRLMEKSWNEAIADQEGTTAEDLYQIVAHPARLTCGFIFDLVNAVSYVMRHKVSVSIPWPSSMDTGERHIVEVDQMWSIYNDLIEMATKAYERFEMFDKEFTGVPADVLGRLSKIEAEDQPRFSEYLESKGLPPREVAETEDANND